MNQILIDFKMKIHYSFNPDLFIFSLSISFFFFRIQYGGSMNELLNWRHSLIDPVTMTIDFRFSQVRK